MEGWVKLHRKLLEWDWFADSYVVHVFIFLLLKANHESRKWCGRTIRRGQYLTSTRLIADELQLNRRTIMRALQVLSESETINVESDRVGGTLITIRKYTDYQSNEQIGGAPNAPPNAPLNAPLNAPKQECKECKNEKNNSKGRFTPPTLEQVVSYCNERKNGVDAQRWFNYYTANGWKVGKNQMKDWQAAVRTWEKGSESKPQRQLESMKTADADSEWK